MSTQPFTPRDAADRAAVVALCVEVAERCVSSVRKYGSCNYEHAIADIVPPVPRVKRRVLLRDGVWATYDGKREGADHAFTVESNRDDFGLQSETTRITRGLNLVSVLSGHCPSVSQSGCARQLLDLIANPETDAPAPASAAQWRELTLEDVEHIMRVREWPHTTAEEDVDSVNAYLRQRWSAPAAPRALSDGECLKLYNAAVNMHNSSLSTGAACVIAEVICRKLRGVLAPEGGR